MSDIIYDATDLKEKGKELANRISKEVNSSEGFIIGSIPSVLKLTKDQYKDLAGVEAFEIMMSYNQRTGKLEPRDKKLFRTKETVGTFKRSGGYILEVQIKE